MTFLRRPLLAQAAGLLLALAAAVPAAQALTPAELFARVAPSVWRVRTYDSEGLPLGLGSAVVVAPETLVTNCHVLRKAERFVLLHDNLTLPGTLELWDAARDVCQVKARGLNAPAVALGETRGLVVGQNVYALGSPAGLELTLSAGLVSSLRRDDDRRLVMIQTSAPISPGSSGGGLFDDQARLIGLTTMTLASASAQNLNFALPADWIRELPQRHRAAREQVAAPAEAASAAPAGSARVPFRSEKREAAFQRYLNDPPPKAFAIADKSHFGWAVGKKPKDLSLPTNPQERALQFCAKAAGKPCVIYAVDNDVVYRP
jgi:serine protease Do